jgi:hypothetical protein
MTSRGFDVSGASMAISAMLLDIIFLRKATKLSSKIKSAPRPGRALTVREVGALSDFDNVTVRIADVAAYLAVLGYRLRDELGSSTFP